MGRVGRAVKKVFETAGFELKRVRPRMETGESVYSNFGEQRVIHELLEKLGISSHFFVDIGAGDGAHMSNTRFLLKRGWHGALMEADPDRFARLAYGLRRFGGTRYANMPVAPGNVTTLLNAFQVPRDFGFLSLDIDSYDYFVLEKILEAFSPRLCCVEINEKVPPPVKFTVKYDPDFKWRKDYFSGMSISQLEKLCLQRGYDIVEVHYNNVFIVPGIFNQSRLPVLSGEEGFKKGYLDKPDRFEKFGWIGEFEKALDMEPQQKVDFIRKYFSAHRGKFDCEL